MINNTIACQIRHSNEEDIQFSDYTQIEVTYETCEESTDSDSGTCSPEPALVDLFPMNRLANGDASLESWTTGSTAGMLLMY